MSKLRQLAAFGLMASSLSSCATILGGRITDYQRTKPLPGQPQREVRIGALVADIFLVGLLGVGVDFATGAIYRPQPSLRAAAPAAPLVAPADAVAPAPPVAPATAPAPVVK